jgi:hypothetical protein
MQNRSGVGEVIDNNIKEIGTVGMKGLLCASAVYAGYTLKELQKRAEANVVCTLAAGGLWLASLTEHYQCFRKMDEIVTQAGNLKRSWRSYVSGGSMTIAVALAGAALNRSGHEGEEMTTVGLAVASGVAANISSFFHTKEIQQAESGKLIRKQPRQQQVQHVDLEQGEGSQNQVPLLQYGQRQQL